MKTTTELLEQVRALMRELIDRLQTDAPAGQAHVPASLLRILVHVVNIQKTVEQASESPVNAVKRLKDFANTIERLKLGDEKMANARDLQVQLIAVLRQSADQLGDPGAAATWTAGDELAPAS